MNSAVIFCWVLATMNAGAMAWAVYTGMSEAWPVFWPSLFAFVGWTLLGFREVDYD